MAGDKAVLNFLEYSEVESIPLPVRNKLEEVFLKHQAEHDDLKNKYEKLRVNSGRICHRCNAMGCWATGYSLQIQYLSFNFMLFDSINTLTIGDELSCHSRKTCLVYLFNLILF